MNLCNYKEYAIGGGWGKETKEIGLEAVSIIRGTDFSKIENGDFSTIPKRFETSKKIASRKVEVGDLIIEISGGSAASGQRTGRCLYITQEIIDKLGNPIIPASFCRLLRLKNINQKFIYYQIKLMHINDEIGLYENQSTGISNFQFNLFLDNVYPLVEKREIQDKVVSFLEKIDDKILLNTQTNQTLEAIAQAIFKSWFVDFAPVRAKAQAILDGKTSDEANLSAMAVISGKAIEDLSQTEYQELWEIADAFPSEFVENDLPKGWRIDKVGDIVNVIDYVANGSFASLKENVTLLDEPDYAIYVRTTDFNSGFSKDLKYVNKHSYDFLKKSSLNGNDIIISNVGDVGTVFRPPSWLNIPMTLGSNAIALKSENLSNYLYLYFKSSFGQWQIQGITSGSAQMKFNKTGFRGLEILIPNKKILSFFENQLNEIYNKITNNLKENKTLAQTRDELLPKLLSGEI